MTATTLYEIYSMWFLVTVHSMALFFIVINLVLCVLVIPSIQDAKVFLTLMGIGIVVWSLTPSSDVLDTIFKN